ncbi:hypothetical protein J6590_042768 [Homalodisca vitripennis]|nr:hypothetical protein J6590_042768 [Homalodisca vitripennis]
MFGSKNRGFRIIVVSVLKHIGSHRAHNTVQGLAKGTIHIRCDELSVLVHFGGVPRTVRKVLIVNSLCRRFRFIEQEPTSKPWTLQGLVKGTIHIRCDELRFVLSNRNLPQSLTLQGLAKGTIHIRCDELSVLVHFGGVPRTVRKEPTSKPWTLQGLAKGTIHIRCDELSVLVHFGGVPRTVRKEPTSKPWTLQGLVKGTIHIRCDELSVLVHFTTLWFLLGNLHLDLEI